MRKNNTKKLTKEEFIIRAIKIHDIKYDYSLVEYVNYLTKVKIICPIHGEFEKTPIWHIKGSGCRKCYGNDIKTTEQFILDAKKVHGDRYDYSLVKYVNNKKEVEIICSIHGIFEQSPIVHLKNHGCQKCAGVIKGEHLRYTTEEFIKMSNKIHNNKYDYSLANYINIETKIKIICSKHGEFNQISNYHLHGNGCPICCESRGEYSIRKLLENNNIDFKARKIFNNCKNIRCLPFDFYLPNHNTCIEYDGIQHFEPIDFFGGEIALKSLKERDNIKTEYCKNNNINLLRIKFNENIKEKLNNYLIGLT